MLLNEFLKEHWKVDEEQVTIAELKSTVAQQQKDVQATATRRQKEIEALTGAIQKVSAQIELSIAASRTVCLPHRPFANAFGVALREGGSDH
jgi:hypothetical protein